MYRGNDRGGFVTGQAETIGSGWQPFTALLTPRDWNGDGRPDLLARDADGAAVHVPRQRPRRLHHRPARADRHAAGRPFTALLAPGDWSGDGKPDILARDADGLLFMYRGNGRGGFVTGQREQIGSGWQGFTALFAGGDFSGDGRPDLVARDADGLLFMYRGNGRGGFVTGQREQIGSGWNSLSALTLVWDPIPRPPRPLPPRRRPPRSRTAARGSRSPRAAPARAAASRSASASAAAPAARRRACCSSSSPCAAGRSGSTTGGRSSVRLRMNQPAGKRGRVRARVYYRRAGSRKLRQQDGVEAVQDVQAGRELQLRIEGKPGGARRGRDRGCGHLGRIVSPN